VSPDNQVESSKGTFPSKVHQFKAGQTGNPKGRPPGPDLMAILAEILEGDTPGKPGKKVKHAVMEALVRECVKGKPELLKMLMERFCGKVPDTLNIQGGDTPVLHSAVDAAKQLMQDPKRYAESLAFAERLRNLPATPNVAEHTNGAAPLNGEASH